MPRKKKVKETPDERYARLVKALPRGEPISVVTETVNGITRTIRTYQNGEQAISEKVGNIRI